jgi:hypothetical protein
VRRYLKETYPLGGTSRWYKRYTTDAVGPFFSRHQAERLLRLELVFFTLPQPIITPRVVEDARGCKPEHKAE